MNSALRTRVSTHTNLSIGRALDADADELVEALLERVEGLDKIYGTVSELHDKIEGFQADACVGLVIDHGWAPEAVAEVVGINIYLLRYDVELEVVARG